MKKKRKRSWGVVEGPRRFPCPICKGKAGWNEGEPDCSWFEPCGFCQGEGHIETGSEKHRETLLMSFERWMTTRLCRKNDDYYACDDALPAWCAAMTKIAAGLNEAFDLYRTRYAAGNEYLTKRANEPKAVSVSTEAP